MASPPPNAPTSPDPGGADGVALSVSRPARPAGPSAALVWVGLAIIYLVWGSTYLAIRISVETLPPLLSAGARFGAAGVVLGLILLVRRGPRGLRVTRRQLAGAAIVGVLLLAGGNGLVVVAESGPPGTAVPSGIAALLIATVPLIVVVLRAITGDRPGRTTVAGVVVGFAGLVLLVLPRGGSGAVPLLGALTVVVAAICWSTGSFLAQKLTMPADPFVATVYEMIAGAAVLAALGVARGETQSMDLGAVSTRSWVALGYLVVAGSLIAFTAYVWLLHHAPISLVATYAYVNPVVAVILGALVVAEPVTLPVVLGGAIIVLGVALVVSTERPRAAG